jgi:hypothetical protein
MEIDDLPGPHICHMCDSRFLTEHGLNVHKGHQHYKDTVYRGAQTWKAFEAFVTPDLQNFIRLERLRYHGTIQRNRIMYQN